MFLPLKQRGVDHEVRARVYGISSRIVSRMVQRGVNLGLSNQKAEAICDLSVDAARSCGEAWSYVDGEVDERPIGDTVSWPVPSPPNPNTGSRTREAKKFPASRVSFQYLSNTLCKSSVGCICRVLGNARKSPFVSALLQKELVNMEVVSTIR
jgi:hypothetical protein